MDGRYIAADPTCWSECVVENGCVKVKATSDGHWSYYGAATAKWLQWAAQQAGCGKLIAAE